MPEEVFVRIIDEIASWPSRPTGICPFLTNEPFADARIYDWCGIINQKLPDVVLYFYTNGSLFNERTIEKLRSVKNIQIINISLHHSNPAEYEAELGIPWPKTIMSIGALIQANKSAPFTKAIEILRVGNNDQSKDRAFLAFCAACFPGTKAWIATRWNWKGDIKSPTSYEPYLDIICPRTKSMCILASGKVALCCLDQDATYALGDISNRTLLDVYNADLARKYRENTKRNLVPCRRCNMR